MESQTAANLDKSGNAINSVLFGREPALWLAVIQAALAMMIGFGLNLSNEQFALLMGLVGAVAGLVVRSRVTPVTTTSK
jgi:hypothetical protein